MTPSKAKAVGSFADVLREETVRSAESFHVSREEARSAEIDHALVGVRRNALLKSLRRSAHRSGKAELDKEAVRKKRVRIIRDGVAADVESEARQIRRELQTLKRKNDLSVAAENLASSFDASLKIYLEKKKLLERIEKTLDSRLDESTAQPSDAKKTPDHKQGEAGSDPSLEKIVKLAAMLRNDVIRLMEDLVSNFERLDDQLQSNIREEEIYRTFFHVCLVSLDETTRDAVTARSCAMCRNASIDKRSATYRTLVEGLARTYPSVARHVHRVARRRARDYLKQNRANEAVGELFSAIHLWREDPETYRMLIKALSSRGDKEGAFTAQRELLRLCPDDLQLRKRVATEWDLRGKKKEAISEYEELISRYPEDLKVRRELGRLLFETNAHKRIPDVLAEYIRAYPNDAECRLWIGTSLVRTENWQAAIPHLKLALDLGTDKWKPSLLLAIAYRKLELFDEALQVVEACTHLSSCSEQAHMLLGDILQERGKFGEAEATYRKALEFRGSSLALLLALGHVQESQGKIREAVSTFKEACQMDPTSDEAFLEMGKALRRQGTFEEAEAALKKAIELNSDSMVVRQELSLLYVEFGKLKMATAVLRPLLEREANRKTSARLESEDN